MKKKFYDIIPPPGYMAEEPKRKIPERRKSCFFQPAFGIIKVFILRTAVLLLIVALNWLGLSVAIHTFAYFSDKATSPENTILLGILALSLYPEPTEPVIMENMKPGDELAVDIQVLNEGTLPFRYTGWVEKIDGDDELCDALQLEARLDEDVGIDYRNGLMDFCFIPLELETPDGMNNWEFKISLPEEVSADLENKLCEFAFIFNARQINSDSLPGFSDTAEVIIIMETGQWTPENGETTQPSVTITTSLTRSPGSSASTTSDVPEEETDENNNDDNADDDTGDNTDDNANDDGNSNDNSDSADNNGYDSGASDDFIDLDDDSNNSNESQTDEDDNKNSEQKKEEEDESQE